MSSQNAEANLDGILKQLTESLEVWRDGKRDKKGRIDANVFCAGLYVTEHICRKFPLEEADFVTESQVKGASGPAARKILARHGENRKFLTEGGRTSRKTRPTAVEVAELLKQVGCSHGLQLLPDSERKKVGSELQAWFVRQIQNEYFTKEAIKADISHDKPVQASVAALLDAARGSRGNTAGAVAQHLVGAKLALRFPDIEITNDSSTTADLQTNRHGDFQVGDTAIHVTMNPMPQLFEGRCLDNIRQGYRPRVLVPQNNISKAESMGMQVDDKIAVQSIEGFVGMNVEEMAGFVADRIRSGLRLLLEKYNERVQAVESDPGLLIAIPSNL